MAQITWAENYGVIRERLRSFESEVMSMNSNGWASKNTLHSFASRLYDFNRVAVPQLMDRCRELAVGLDKAIALAEKKDREIATMAAERSADERDNDTEETLEKARLELELEKARLEIERLRLQVQRLEERGDGKGVTTTEE